MHHSRRLVYTRYTGQEDSCEVVARWTWHVNAEDVLYEAGRLRIEHVARKLVVEARLGAVPAVLVLQRNDQLVHQRHIQSRELHPGSTGGARVVILRTRLSYRTEDAHALAVGCSSDANGLAIARREHRGGHLDRNGMDVQIREVVLTLDPLQEVEDASEIGEERVVTRPGEDFDPVPYIVDGLIGHVTVAIRVGNGTHVGRGDLQVLCNDLIFTARILVIH